MTVTRQLYLNSNRILPAVSQKPIVCIIFQPHSVITSTILMLKSHVWHTVFYINIQELTIIVQNYFKSEEQEKHKKIIVVKTLFFFHLNYCDVVIYDMTSKLSIRLQRAQSYCLCFILNLCRDEHVLDFSHNYLK